MKDLRRKAHALEPVLRIGKQGLAEGVIEQVRHELRQKGLVKIKILKSATQDREERRLMAERISKETGSAIIQQTGGILVLHKR